METIQDYLIYSRLKIQSEIIIQTFEECVKKFKTPELEKSEIACAKHSMVDKMNLIEKFN
jgi:hypothetical protein